MAHAKQNSKNKRNETIDKIEIRLPRSVFSVGISDVYHQKCIIVLWKQWNKYACRRKIDWKSRVLTYHLLWNFVCSEEFKISNGVD